MPSIVYRVNKDIPLNDKWPYPGKNVNGRILKKNYSEPRTLVVRVKPSVARSWKQWKLYWTNFLRSWREESHNKNYDIHEDLREIEFGRWKVLIWSEVQTLNPDLAREWKDNRWSTLTPQGESYERLSARVGRWLKVNKPQYCCCFLMVVSVVALRGPGGPMSQQLKYLVWKFLKIRY